MFRIVWGPVAFERMQQLISTNPQRRAEFAAALQKLTSILRSEAAEWGESRNENVRVGFVGPLAVLVRVDEDDAAVMVADLELFDEQARPGIE